MRRRQIFLSLTLAASLAGGCLGSGGYGSSDPTGGSQSQPSNGGSADQPTTGGNPDNGGSTAGNAGSSGAAGMSGSGGSGGSGGTVTPPPPPAPPAKTGSIAIALDKSTDTVRLNETKTYTATITPADGFSGNVVLSLEGAPTGISATFTPANINVTTAAPVTVSVAVKVASDMATPAASVPLSIKGTSGTITGSAALGVMVPAELLVAIPSGVDIGTAAAKNMTAFGTYGTPVLQVAAGTKVTWVNNDKINHEIHSDGGLGIKHEGGPLMANAANSYTQTFNATGTFTYRCHIHPNMVGQIVVK